MVMLDIEPINMEMITKVCSKCQLERKFVKGTPRDKQNICGNCWDWEAEPSYLKLTKEEAEKLSKILEQTN